MNKEKITSPTFAASGSSKQLNQKNYNANLVREKAKNKWLDIWDSCGICLNFQENETCPLCRTPTAFDVKNKETGDFYCKKCNANGDGMMLIQLYRDWEFFDVLEEVGRYLRIRPREVIL